MSKQPICPICGEPYVKYRSTQRVCFSVECASKWVELKAKEKADKEWKRETKRMKDSLFDGDRKHWLKKAQEAFNEYVRIRDAKDPCISCGKYENELNINHWIKLVCGHFLSVGSTPELRFHPYNANIQCTRCNGGAGKYGQFNGRLASITESYRAALVAKIGEKAVEWLEGPHIAQKWNIEDLKDIRDYYKELTRELRKAAVQTETD